MESRSFSLLEFDSIDSSPTETIQSLRSYLPHFVDERGDEEDQREGHFPDQEYDEIPDCLLLLWYFRWL
jgi:hypothetical protein